jgi:hypothetical protein
VNDAAAQAVAGEPAEGAVNPDLPSTIESVGSVTASVILNDGALCLHRTVLSAPQIASVWAQAAARHPLKARFLHSIDRFTEM